MAVKYNEKAEFDFPVPTAPPPPNLPKHKYFNDGKNLMKSAATLIGKEEGKTDKESALDVCKSFLRRNEADLSEECNISWSYHNNDVESYLQDGPTCGLVAVKLAADILTFCGSQSSDDIDELLKVAQKNCFTYQGEMFSAQDMGLLAKTYYGLKFEVVYNGLDDYVYLIKHLCKGYPVLVPYDADRNHEPCLKRGHKAHWAVITGFLVGLKDETVSVTDMCTDDKVTPIHPFCLDKVQIPYSFEGKHLFLLARQGKSRHYAVWSWVDLNNSNKNLFEFDGPNVNVRDLSSGMSDSEKTNYMFTEGVETGLCSKVVFLFP